jgi:hypothetical protein
LFFAPKKIYSTLALQVHRPMNLPAQSGEIFMKMRIASSTFVLLISTLLTIPKEAVADALPDPAFAATAAESQPASPALMWAVRRGGQAVLGWVTGQVVDWAADRAGVTRALHNALDNLAGINNDPSVPASIRIELQAVQRDFATYRDILARNTRSDAQTRAELRGLQRDFAAYVQSTNALLARLDVRLSHLEREQRRHLRLITDLDGRVRSLGNRLVDAEGRVTDLEGRVATLEDRVDRHDAIINPDPDRFLRHEAYLSGGLLYANSPTMGGEAAVGAEVSAQYNFNQFLGVFAGLSYMPLNASDVDSVADGASMTWDNANLQLGATASLLDPRSPVSIQLGAGGGIASSRLLFYDQGVERTSENGQEMGTSSNVFLLVKAEVGAAPPAYSFEPIATVGYMTFMEDVAYHGSEVSSNMGRSVWFVSLGLRFRQYLRGTGRQGLPAGLSGLRR